MENRGTKNRVHPPTPSAEVVEELSKAAVAVAADSSDPLGAIVELQPMPREVHEFVRSIELDEEVYALRLAGYTPSEIAHSLTQKLKRRVTTAEVDDMSESVASANITRTNQQIASTFQLELDRLDRAMKAIWPAICDGNLQAIDRMDKLQQRRAKMLGLDAPDIRAQVTLNSEGLDLSTLSREEIEQYKQLHLKARTASSEAKALSAKVQK